MIEFHDVEIDLADLGPPIRDNFRAFVDKVQDWFDWVVLHVGGALLRPLLAYILATAVFRGPEALFAFGAMALYLWAWAYVK